MDFNILKDMELVRDLLDITMDELAEAVGVSRITLYNWLEEKTVVTPGGAAAFYSMAFNRGIRLNRIKEQFYREDYINENHVVLFHGAKSQITGSLDIKKSRKNNDFGQGFYCGESLEQSAMFVANYPESSLYIVDFDKRGLREKHYVVDQEWMLTIAYFRGRLGEFKDSPVIEELTAKIKDTDYIVAPIADNRMFEIIDSFIDGEITDVQCRHCLSATNLGNQYVFISQQAIDCVRLLERCYLAKEEKLYYLNKRKESGEIGRDEVKAARRKYRGQGKYIEEILG